MSVYFEYHGPGTLAKGSRNIFVYRKTPRVTRAKTANPVDGRLSVTNCFTAIFGVHWVTLCLGIPREQVAELRLGRAV